LNKRERALLSAVDQPLILGLVDLFLRHNSIERVEFIAKELEKLELDQRLQQSERRPI
jgi:hypothetical protein